jgi:hypothetical protein
MDESEDRQYDGSDGFAHSSASFSFVVPGTNSDAGTSRSALR